MVGIVEVTRDIVGTVTQGMVMDTAGIAGTVMAGITAVTRVASKA